ncbi:MAG TPA: class I SAM-dependent methyltransferase [Verrucomicrobiae bacterium]|nr:class I SAM-dependent methyltransferase [Verrucomicrobiae bacterium]
MRTELLQECSICCGQHFQLLDPECNIARCASCGYIFDNPRPSLEELIHFYSKPAKYDSWLEELSGRDRMWKRRLRKLKSSRKPGSLLDVGTGIGQFLHLARPLYTSVHGTEVSTTAIGIARDRYGLDVFQGTIHDLATQHGYFDNITLFHVLEHVPDPREVLSACHSLLTDGGVLVIAVPNEVASLRGFVKRALTHLGLRKHQSGKLGLPLICLDGSISEVHLSHFTPRVLRYLLETTGFSVISATLDPYYVRRSARSWLKADLYYYFCLAVRAFSRVNIFDAMLLIAKKEPLLAQEAGSSQECAA